MSWYVEILYLSSDWLIEPSFAIFVSVKFSPVELRFAANSGVSDSLDEFVPRL